MGDVLRRWTDGRLLSADAPATEIRVLDQIEVTGDATRAYLAYASLAHDLELAHELLDRLDAHPAPPAGQDDFERMALWIAITTTYGRCFGPGRRRYFAETLIPQYFDEAFLHGWMVAHRNRTIAHLHKLSDGETARAFLGVDGTEAVAIRLQGERWLMPDPPTTKRLRRLFRYLMLKARQRRDNAGRKIVDAVRAMPPDVITTAKRRGRAVYVHRQPDTPEEARAWARPKPRKRQEG